MIEIFEILPTRTTTGNGMELDAIEHPRAIRWGQGERKAIKQGMNRRMRRKTRQMIRSTY